MQNRSKIEFANTLRGFAALSVVISHYLSTFWYKRDSVSNLINAPLLTPENYATPIYILWLNKFLLFDWGAYGVGLFFIISGFVIPFSVHKTSSFGFCLNRFFRIIPTYFIGFTITLLALFWGAKYFKSTWPYTLQEIFIHYLPGIRDLFDSKIIDVIIWTLEIEMKFYLIVALSIVWFRSYSFRVFLIPTVFFLLTCYLSQMLPTWAMTNFSAFIWARIYMFSSQYIIFMFIGVAFHYLYCRKIEADKAFLGVGVLFLLFCIAWWAGPDSGNLIMAWSYAFALLTFMFAYIFPQFFKKNPLVNFFANISYPLYIIHSIAGYIALRIMMDMGFKVWVSLITVLLSSIFCSWLLHIFIENPSQRLGRKLATYFSYDDQDRMRRGISSDSGDVSQGST